ncbi:MAG: uracil-DNA glycosylase family protein [Aquabacterium sp.]
MRWSERQLAMLREMGIPPFWPQVRAEAEPAAPVAVAEEAERAQPPSERPGRPAVVAPVSAPLPAPLPAPSAAPVAPISQPLTLDWPALRQAVQACQACGLSAGRTQTVFGVGHEQAHWMLVGEAPGEQEDRQGEPFVGRAGQLLDRMLHAVGLTRSEAGPEQQVYIANVIKCRPPANRNPQPAEVAQCAPYLARQLALVQPRIVLAMGRFAAQTLLKTDAPIGRLRGQVHRLDSGVPVIVTYHPAYLLRNPADKALVWDDLCLAREVMAQSPM